MSGIDPQDDDLENGPEVDNPEIDDAPVVRDTPKPPRTAPKRTTTPDSDNDVSYWKGEASSARREAQRHRHALRNVEAERDSHATRAAKYDILLEQFGIEDETAFDPKSFADEYKDILTSHQHTRRKYAVHKAASKAGADPDMLLDSNSFMSKVVDLDPDDKKFGDSLEKLIADSLEKNPVFSSTKKSAPSTQTATPEVKGSNGEVQITADQLKGMSTADIVKARREGKLKHLGF